MVTVMFPQYYLLVEIFNLQKIPNLKLKQSIGDFFVFTQTSSNFAKAWNGLRKNTKLYIEQCLVHKKGYPLILDWGDTWCLSEVIICSWKSFLKSFSRKFCTQKASRFLISSLVRVILGPFMPTLRTKSARKLYLL